MAASLALHAVVSPSIMAVETEDPTKAAALNSIRVALEKAEAANPGVVHELIDIILDDQQSKGGEESIAKLLRIAGREIEDYNFNASTSELKDLKVKTGSLKSILATVPDQIGDRTKFLAIIRQIAGNIKDLLESVSAVFANNSGILGESMPQLEQHKKVFVRVSKSFSETLKRFFKDGKQDAVLRSAHRLINQTNLLARTIKQASG